MGKKEICLCRPCAEKRKKTQRLRAIRNGVNLKITCEDCQRRRFGAVYSADTKE